MDLLVHPEQLPWESELGDDGAMQPSRCWSPPSLVAPDSPWTLELPRSQSPLTPLPLIRMDDGVDSAAGDADLDISLWESETDRLASPAPASASSCSFLSGSSTAASAHSTAHTPRQWLSPPSRCRSDTDEVGSEQRRDSRRCSREASPVRQVEAEVGFNSAPSVRLTFPQPGQWSSAVHPEIDRFFSLYRPAGFPFRVIGQCVSCGSHRPPCHDCPLRPCSHGERQCRACLGEVLYRLEPVQPCSCCSLPRHPCDLQSGVAEVLLGFVPDWEQVMRHPVPDALVRQQPSMTLLTFAHYVISYQQLWTQLWTHLAGRERQVLLGLLRVSDRVLDLLWSFLAALTHSLQQLLHSQHCNSIALLAVTWRRWGPPSVLSPMDWKRALPRLHQSGPYFSHFAQSFERELRHICRAEDLISGAMAAALRSTVWAESGEREETKLQLHFLLSQRSAELARALRFCVDRQLVHRINSMCQTWQRQLEPELPADGAAVTEELQRCSAEPPRPETGMVSTMSELQLLLSRIQREQRRCQSTLPAGIGDLQLDDIERLVGCHTAYHSRSILSSHTADSSSAGLDLPDILTSLLSAPPAPSPSSRQESALSSPPSPSAPESAPSLPGSPRPLLPDSAVCSPSSETGGSDSPFLLPDCPSPCTPAPSVAPVAAAVVANASALVACKLWLLLPGCLRFLPSSTSSEGSSARGRRALCARCQQTVCVLKAGRRGSSASRLVAFHPVTVDPQRLLLLRLTARDAPLHAEAGTGERKKRRTHGTPAVGLTKCGDTDSALRQLQDEAKLDEQGRLTNRDRTIHTAQADTALQAKRLTVQLDEQQECWLYAFASPDDCSAALSHWLLHARSLTRLSLQCHRLSAAVRIKYCHAGEELQIDRAQLQLLMAADAALVSPAC